MRSFAVRAVFITILTITLFSSTIFFVTIPALESHIMDQKREMIRELTTSAWNILAKFENDERTGIVTREEAQKQAILQIRNLHYGQQMKDYFWINDMTPRMVVHPYRSDLDGKDLTTFADPDGKRLFVEVVRTVKEHGAGYVSYRWQWKDDSARVVPKLSYVKGFEPWNWVIGTGVYVEDVQNEIRSAKQQLLLISLAILGIASLFLFYLLWDSLRTERKRRLAEQALKNSEEKYRLLVESAGECIVMAIGNERLFANQSMLQLLGYTPEAFAPLRIDEIIGLTEDERASGHSYPVRLMRGEAVPSRYETFLRTSQGERREVTLSLSRITIQEKTGFIAVATEITRRRQREIEQERLLGELNETVLFLNRSVKNICRRDLVTVKAGSTLGDVCRKMVEENLPAVLVAEEAGGVRGLLSREGAFRRLADSSRAWSEPIGAAAIEQSAGIPQQAMVAEALLALEKHEFHPLLVMAEDGSVAGVLTEREISLLNRYSPTVLLREIAAAESSEALIRANRRLPELVRVLVRNGIRTTHINRIITQNSDAVLERAVHLACAKLGPPPAEFVFLVMGSEGRHEQTLRTDQDNAIVYADPAPEAAESTHAYFLSLGQSVCETLDRAGYAFCTGDVMAKNPRWCQPLSRWRRYFADWVGTLEAEDLLQSKIFFDFRAGVGESRFVCDLRRMLEETIEQHPRFFFLLARNVLLFQPPIGLFGNFVLEADQPEARAIDIKGVMALIVDFARIYALKNRLSETNTRDRLAALLRLEVLTRESYDEMIQAYNYLMRLRLENQVRAVEENRPPDNLIDPYTLTSINQKMLKEVFAQIKHFQVKLSYDFTGMMQQL